MYSITMIKTNTHKTRGNEMKKSTIAKIIEGNAVKNIKKLRQGKEYSEIRDMKRTIILRGKRYARRFLL